MVRVSSVGVSENLRRVCEGLADEIAARWAAHVSVEEAPGRIGLVRAMALAVLLDWFLGDFIPSDRRDEDGEILVARHEEEGG